MNEPDGPEVTGIYHFLPVDADLATGGQPSAEELASLARAGYQTIVNLGLHNDPRYSLRDEQGCVTALGMEYIHIPVQFGKPASRDLELFFDAMDRRGGKTFVHCAANKRVTVFLGLYRVIKFGWLPEEAFALMNEIWVPDAVWSAFIVRMLSRRQCRSPQASPVPAGSTVDRPVAPPQADRKTTGNRVAPLDLYRCTPRTNCGECGQNTCLAFATLVVTAQLDISACPWLNEERVRPLRGRLQEQFRSGIGVTREGFEKTMEYLREEIEKCDFSVTAASLGAKIEGPAGSSALILPYFSELILVTKSDINKLSGGGLSPWEKIFIFNYVIAGAAEPSGVWVGMESLPNSVSKIKSLKAHCEGPLSRLYSGKMPLLSQAVSPWGREVSLQDQGVDFAAEFPVFPKLAIRVLFWDEVEDEGYASQVKFLFDSRVLQVLDLESLLFACEQITDRLSGKT